MGHTSPIPRDSQSDQENELGGWKKDACGALDGLAKGGWGIGPEGWDTELTEPTKVEQWVQETTSNYSWASSLICWQSHCWLYSSQCWLYSCQDARRLSSGGGEVGEQRGIVGHDMTNRESGKFFFSFSRSPADGIMLQTLTLSFMQKLHSHCCFEESQHYKGDDVMTHYPSIPCKPWCTTPCKDSTNWTWSIYSLGILILISQYPFSQMYPSFLYPQIGARTITQLYYYRMCNFLGALWSFSYCWDAEAWLISLLLFYLLLLSPFDCLLFVWLLELFLELFLYNTVLFHCCFLLPFSMLFLCFLCFLTFFWPVFLLFWHT